MEYTEHVWRDSRVHVLTVDLETERIRAIPAGPTFPLSKFYDRHPPQIAKQAGALASVGAGFPLTSWNRVGVTDQPRGTLAIEGELWTTGVGHGGHVYLEADRRAWVQPSHVEVRVWFEGHATLVNHVNRGHEDTCAFTYRGGTNEVPTGRHLRLLRPLGEFELHQGSWAREYLVDATAPGPVSPGHIVLESDYRLGLPKGETVRWVQHLGAPAVTDVIAGMTELVRDGENVVSRVDLWGGNHGGPDAWYVRKNPRTAIGVHEGGKVAYLVAVEGRVEGSKGLRLRELGRLMVELGAYSAVNLDGGGSSHMWIDGEGLVADSCYGDTTLHGTRPNIYATCVMPR